ncbi:MAG: xylose isomerase [Bdellovibrionota bacterium]
MAKRKLSFRDFGLTTDPFPGVNGRLTFQGSKLKGPLGFQFYNADAQLLGKSLGQHLPFAGALWHFRNPLGDIFSDMGTAIRPWDDGTASFENAERCLRVFFYMLHILGIPYWCWHDFDLVPRGRSLEEFHGNIDKMLPVIKELGDLTGIKVGWTTQNLFSQPRYTEGAATSPDVDVFAQAWAQTKKMLDVNQWFQQNDLGANNHVFWGGREGYRQLLSTQLEQESDQIATFFWTAVRYCEKIGLKVQFLIEPKPKEPSVHQYDHSVEVAIAFLRKYGLQDHFKFNVETNHAQLAGLTVEHECTVAASQGLLGGVDVNEGTFGVGWDTDRFLGDPLIALEIMLPVLKYQGDIGTGVYNFDAKCDRGSFDPLDLIYAHLLGMETMALGTALAAALIDNGTLETAVKRRYQNWEGPLGQGILAGLNDPSKIDFDQLAAHGMKQGWALTPAMSAHHELNRLTVIRTLPTALKLLEG